ncbi:MAG: PKD domain-containing protein, partial [Bacteroidales bacterium]|nr:PKD domain-containing protein [Bacteroidales bacterium]
MRKFRYILLGILIAFSLQIKGQTDTEFWFAKPNITQEHVSENFKIVVTAREFDAEVRIEMPSRTDFTPIVLNVPAFSTVTQNILKSDPRHAIMENTTLIDQRSLVDANRTNIGNKAILITSTSPISVYFTNTTNNNSDIYALKGANGIGREFIIPFQSHGYNMSPSYNERGFSSADIIAIEDGTVVEIIPPAGRSVFRNGLNQNETNPYTITLNRGEVYSCAPGWDATTVTGLPIPGWWGVESNQHLGGLIIRVTSGPGVAVVKKDDSVRDDMGGGYDIIGDQWVPYRGAAGEDNDILGTEYVAMKGGLGNNREWVYVAAPEDNTRIWWGGTIDTTTTMPNATINRGQQQGVQFNSGIYPNDFLNIISNKPLSVLHVSGNGTEMGGAVLPPIDRCTGSTSVTFVRDISWPLYINIMVRAGAQGGFLFDGVVRNDIIDSMAFNPVGLSGDWVAAQFLFTGTGVIDVGDVHTITNTRDVFHLGLINGDTFGGCRFGYFSDFNELDVGANTIQGGGNQPSSSIRACEGDTVQLFATGGSQFLWWPSVNLSSTTISNPTAIVDGFRTYFVRVSGACGISDTASVLVERAIQPNASFFVEQGSGCGPLDLEFRDMSTDVDETYWDFNREGVAGVLDRDTVIWGNGIYNDLDSTFIHTFSNTSTEPSDSIQKYKVRLRVKTARCTDTLSTIITVYPHVTAGFTLGNLADTVSCNPVDVEFISSNLSVNEDFYRWNFGDGALSPIADTIHRYNNISDRDTTYKAQLVVRSQWFCRDTAEMDILVHPYLEGGFTINEDKGCSPLTVRISNLSSGADSIFLDFGDGSDTVMTAFTHVDHLYRNLQTNDGVDTNVVVMRIKNDEGCEFINYDTIVVYPEIRASYNIDGNSYIGCNSRDVVFTNTSNYGTHLASEFLWTFGDGTNLSSTSNTINHTYLNDRNGDIAPTFTLRAQSIYGCFDDTSNIINIYKALAAFHVDTVHGCSPLEVNVVNNSVGDNINSWNWSYGNGATSTNQNPPTYTYLNSGSTIENYNLILEVNHSNGLCSTSDTIAMQIYPSINIDAITLSDVSVCDSTQINFTSTISDAALPDVDYVWNFGDGASSSLANPSHLYRNLNSASQVTYNVRLDVETNRGCVDNVDTTVIVGNVVQSAFSINVSEGCSPLNVTITNNSKGGTYNWYWNSANAIGTPDYTSTQATEQITRDFVNNSGSDMTFDLTLVSLNANGCSDTLTRQILVHSSVRAQFVSTSGLANCTPFTVNFDNQTDPSSDANTFVWDFDDGVTGNTTNLSPDISHTFVNSVTNDRVFNVTLHAESPHGCFHDTSLNITAYSRVEAGISITNNEGCPPFTTNIINTSVGNSANVFEWRVDNALISGSPTDLGDFTHTYNNTDHFNVRDYQVKLTATNPHGCVSTYIDTVEVFEDVVSGYN